MKNKYKEIIPQWYNEETEHDLVLTDDIDSLIPCTVLNMVKGWKMKYFYDFSKVYANLSIMKDGKHDRVWVDCAVIKEKCFDNHLTKISKDDTLNRDAINLNNLYDIDCSNYTDKYNLSTTLLVWSLYDMPIPDSEDGKMILLAIDGSYLGFYSGFRSQTQKYLVEMLDLGDLWDCLERHTKEDFAKIEKKYKLKQKIKYGEQMVTNLPLEKISKEIGIELSLEFDNRFIEWKSFMTIEESVNVLRKEQLQWIGLFSFALTHKNKMKYSVEYANVG